MWCAFCHSEGKDAVDHKEITVANSKANYGK